VFLWIYSSRVRQGDRIFYRQDEGYVIHFAFFYVNWAQLLSIEILECMKEVILKKT